MHGRRRYPRSVPPRCRPVSGPDMRRVGANTPEEVVGMPRAGGGAQWHAMATASTDRMRDPDTSTASTSTARRVWGAVLAVSAGMGMSVQARVNGQLSVELGDSALAAVVSFGGGLVLLLCWLAISRSMRAGTRTALGA